MSVLDKMGFDRRVIWLPVVIMCGFQIGRGVGNTLFGLFALAGVLLLFRQFSNMAKRCRELVFLYLAFIAVFVLSTLVSPDAQVSTKHLLVYVLGSLVLLQQQLYPKPLGINALQAAGWAAVVALVAFLVQFAYTALTKQGDFDPAFDVNGMAAAVLAPWILVLATRYRWWLMGLMLLLLVAADSRTEVLAVLAASVVYMAIIHKKMRWLCLGLPLMLVLAIVFDIVITGRSWDGANLYETVDLLSSHRLVIWHAVLQNPPDNIWLGNGAYTSVGADFVPNVRHFHNMFLEIWYEAGTVGGGLFALLLGYVLWLSVTRYHNATADELHILAVLGAVLVALFVSLLLDKAMHSVFGRFYLFYVLGVFYLWLSRPATDSVEEGQAEAVRL